MDMGKIVRSNPGWFRGCANAGAEFHYSPPGSCLIACHQTVKLDVAPVQYRLLFHSRWFFDQVPMKRNPYLLFQVFI